MFVPEIAELREAYIDRQDFLFQLTGAERKSDEELGEEFDRAIAQIWKDGRESLAADLVRPLGDDGFRPSTPCPYEK